MNGQGHTGGTCKDIPGWFLEECRDTNSIEMTRILSSAFPPSLLPSVPPSLPPHALWSEASLPAS
jgi:hypothetical protein